MMMTSKALTISDPLERKRIARKQVRLCEEYLSRCGRAKVVNLFDYKKVKGHYAIFLSVLQE